MSKEAERVQGIMDKVLNDVYQDGNHQQDGDIYVARTVELSADDFYFLITLARKQTIVEHKIDTAADELRYALRSDDIENRKFYIENAIRFLKDDLKILND